MASDVSDDAKRDRYMQEAISRISEALFRAGNESNLATLTLLDTPVYVLAQFVVGHRGHVRARGGVVVDHALGAIRPRHTWQVSSAQW